MAVAIGLVWASSLSRAADINWNVVGPADWNNAANWDAGLPGAGDTAHVENGGTANIISTAGPVGNTHVSPSLTGNTTVSVRCTKNTPYTVALNAGSTSGGTLAQRLMGSGVNTLQYNLYTSAAATTIFGDGTGSTGTGTGTGAGVATPSTFTVYGQLPDSATNQAAVPGSYSDTVTVTVTY